MINFKKMEDKDFSNFLKKQQYPPAAGATQGNTAYTQNVSLNGKNCRIQITNATLRFIDFSTDTNKC